MLLSIESRFLIHKSVQEIDKTSLRMLENALNRLKIPPPQAPTRNHGLPMPNPGQAAAADEAVADEARSSSTFSRSDQRISRPRKRTNKAANIDAEASQRPQKHARTLSSNAIVDKNTQYVAVGPNISRTVWDVACRRRLGSIRSVQ